MMTTLENLSLFEMTDDLVSMILNSDLFENYLNKKRDLNKSEETQKRIQIFTKMKDQYEEVERFGRLHPDYKEVTKKTRALKRELDMDKNVVLFRQAETDLQSLLDEISMILASSVSENIKVPTGTPFFEKKSGCGASGGNCGCLT